MVTKVFIDGQAGTTGLQISERLAKREDIDLLSISGKHRKDIHARAEMFEASDIAILCLPDNAAKEAVAIATDKCRIIDSSSVHRTNAQWIYGLPELGGGQRKAIASASTVANPGCYPQGFILLIQPLIDGGFLSAEQLITVNAISGYSGGGKALISERQAYSEKDVELRNTETYGLDLLHKHVPEMAKYSGCKNSPLFVPTVGHFYQGMIVQIPLFTRNLIGRTKKRELRNYYMDHYANEPFVKVIDLNSQQGKWNGFLNPTSCNETNRLEIMVFGHDDQLLLCARYDNLGKGAAGAAIQNLNLMIGAEETMGLHV
ncbi:MAG: N-acetyl-gamma-glutamyl-phosphate reductase [Gammaproteobacteria bacterium]|nr:N-acetyl-gamma-glutamyl-phosphate reductase [Gammaproteobacteria bacterium]